MVYVEFRLRRFLGRGSRFSQRNKVVTGLRPLLPTHGVYSLASWELLGDKDYPISVHWLYESAVDAAGRDEVAGYPGVLVCFDNSATNVIGSGSWEESMCDADFGGEVTPRYVIVGTISSPVRAARLFVSRLCILQRQCLLYPKNAYIKRARSLKCPIFRLALRWLQYSFIPLDCVEVSESVPIWQGQAQVFQLIGHAWAWLCFA